MDSSEKGLIGEALDWFYQGERPLHMMLVIACAGVAWQLSQVADFDALALHVGLGENPSIIPNAEAAPAE